ncbi:GNAT superfamily N-acetyltransferase [Catenulispora sp. EB89]|uniref:GNAT family N-acetyltransferase n=1 Tax=Catenulispora sp. EB89 TaxID=3156257 RepID=UPI003514280A
MTSASAPGLMIAIGTAADATEEWAERVAVLTRAAYAGSDPWPILPAPDGATESAESVLRFVARGGMVWTATDPADGDLIAVLRTEPRADASGFPAWFVSRVGTAAAHRGTGVGRRLLAEVEQAAIRHAVAVLRLDAVIERCVPPFYAALGYRVVAHLLAEDDKLLTEVAMERAPVLARRACPPFPMTNPVTAAAPVPQEPATAVLLWFLDGASLAALPCPESDTLASALAHARRVLGQDLPLAGADLWRGSAQEFADTVRAIPGARTERGTSALRFSGGRADNRAHLMPRTHHRDLWAAFRPAPGAEPPITSFPVMPPRQRSVR